MSSVRGVAAVAAVLACPVPSHAVIHGGPANQADTGWFASYAVEGGRCGGTVIGSQWILTAAHCAEHVATWGSAAVRVNPTTFGKGSPVYTVDRAVIHEGFRPGGKLPNDIAVLHVTRPLPAARMLLEANPARPRKGQPLTAYGFGATGPRDYNGSKRLMVARVRDQSGPAGRCGAWKGNRFDAAIQVCANDPALRVDTCGGDSGGPLVAGNGRQVGIVSSGADVCNGSPAKPGIYTRVSAYIGWIEYAQTAPQILVESAQCPPPDRACDVNRGATLALTVRNAGASAGSWRLGGVPSSVAVSSRSGTLAAGESTQVGVTVRSGAGVCAPLEFRGSNLRPTVFKLYLNGGLRGC